MLWAPLETRRDTTRVRVPSAAEMLLDLALPVPPLWLIRAAVAAVWLYEGSWCKLLGRGPGQREVVESVPFLGPRLASGFLYLLGTLETCLGLWVLLGYWPELCVIVQTGLLVGLNSGGILWARQKIHDPAGMVVKNVSFLILAWVGANSSSGAP
jgi:uncharacterized membrane protein YphA (DoxX/SURF4 family)